MELFRTILLMAPVLLFSFIAHEYAHGYAALKQGDTTARDLGFLTWNPIKQIDPVMTVIVPLMLAASHLPILGGVKGVPVDVRNFRHPVRGDIIVSLAGVTTNFCIAVISVPLIILVGKIGQSQASLSNSLSIVQQMLDNAVKLNLLLTMFNLLPFPPLDGSRVFKYLLPAKLAAAYQRVGPIGYAVLFAVIFFGGSAIFAPIGAAYQSVSGLYSPFMLPSPFPQ
ncbi:MAG: site-2 protease family protein [Gemmatimonadaceae bacterium]